MTIQATFFNWQTSGLDWDAPPYEACAPNGLLVLGMLVTRHGGKNLGCHHDRSIVNGAAPSTHAYGAAFDWGYDRSDHNGPGRQVLLDVIIPDLINNSAEYGIDAIHDYLGDRIWRAGRTDDIADAHTLWWRKQNGSGGQMGRDWATWIHVETHRDQFGDTRPIDDRLGTRLPIDLIDMSRWNTITKYAHIRDVPLVHQTQILHGVDSITADPKFASRMSYFKDKRKIIGGYVPLIGGERWPIDEQMDFHFRQMDMIWKPGCFSQLDVEAWGGDYPLVTINELSHALDRHADRYGPDRCMVYMNPNEVPKLWAEFIQRHPSVARWIPNYSPIGDEQARRHGATIHQWSGSIQPSGFSTVVPVNQIIDCRRLAQVAGLENGAVVPPPVVVTPPVPTPDPIKEYPVKPFLWSPKGYANVFLIGAGSALALSGTAYQECLDQGLELIDQDDHPWMLDSVLHQAGLTRSALVERT